MQLRGLKGTGRAGKVAGSCAFLLALGMPSLAYAQFYGGGNDARTMLSPGAFAGVGDQDNRDLALIPMVGLQESFTDNAFLTSTNKQYDFITTPMVGAFARSQGGPLVGTVSGHGFYDAYAREGSLNGFSADAQGIGTYTLVPAFLNIEAEGFLTNTYVSGFGVAAQNRSGLSNRVQVADYGIGPHMTTTLGDFADLNVVGRFSQIFFDNPSGSTAAIPTGSTIEQGSAVLDTDSRFAGFQFVTDAQYARDDHSFEGYSGMQSAYVNITEDIRAIARGGYDAATDPGIVDIHAPLWSAGLEYNLNSQSKISLERGERYNHVAWAADLHLQLSDKIFAEGRYTETLQPDQLQVSGAFSDFVTQLTLLPPPLIQNTFGLTNNLTGQVSLNKFADLHLVYDWEGDRIDFSSYWNDQLFVASNIRTQSLRNGVTYTRQIAEDINGSVGAFYWRTFGSPVFGSSELYSGNVTVTYDVNSTMRAYAGYNFQHQAQLGVGGLSLSENVLYAAVAKRF